GLNLARRVCRFVKNENGFVGFLGAFLIISAGEDQKCCAVRTKRGSNPLAQSEVASSWHSGIQRSQHGSRRRIGSDRESVWKTYRIAGTGGQLGLCEHSPGEAGNKENRRQYRSHIRSLGRLSGESCL